MNKVSKATAIKPHWYLRHIRECPVCGADDSYRVRMYTPRPENPDERIVYGTTSQGYCGCMDKQFY